MGGSTKNTETRGENGCGWMENGAETRYPTEEEVGEVGGCPRKVAFGEHKDKTYVEVLTKNPKYAEYLMNEGRHGRLEVKKFAKRIQRGEISIVAEVGEEGSFERWGFAPRMEKSVVFGRFVIFAGNQGGWALLRKVINE